MEFDRLVAVDLLVNVLITEALEERLSVEDDFRPKRGFHRSFRRTLPFLITTPPVLLPVMLKSLGGSPSTTPLEVSRLCISSMLWESLLPPKVVNSSSSSKLERSTITPKREFPSRGPITLELWSIGLSKRLLLVLRWLTPTVRPDTEDRFDADSELFVVFFTILCTEFQRRPSSEDPQDVFNAQRSKNSNFPKRR